MNPTENEIAEAVLDAAFEIHRELRPGLLECVYETVLAAELTGKGFSVKRQTAIPFRYKHLTFDDGFHADLIVNDKVIVELKSVKALEPIFSKQLLTYLHPADKRLGLLINFNELMLRNGIKRVINGLKE